MTARSGYSWLRGLVPLIAVLVPLALTAWLNSLAPVVLQPVWNGCRAASYPAAVVAAVAVVFRLVMMAAELVRWQDRRALHIMAWFAWIVAVQILAGLGARYYDSTAAPATWLSGARLLLHFVAIALSLWWPHPERFPDPQEDPAS